MRQPQPAFGHRLDAPVGGDILQVDEDIGIAAHQPQLLVRADADARSDRKANGG